MRHAFTLIELLIVIAIIALLAAILFPVFGRARENARKSSCQSNLKQIGLGMMQYSQDYDELLPLAMDGNLSVTLPDVLNPFSGSGENRKFSMAASTLQPYLKSQQIFVCPSDARGASRGLSYAINRCIVNNQDAARRWYGRSLAYFQDTTQWVSWCEEAHTTFNTTDDGLINIGFATNQLSVRHLEGSNFAFMDGHVKWMRPERVHLNGLLVGGVYSTSARFSCPA